MRTEPGAAPKPGELLPDDLPRDPLPVVEAWLDEAVGKAMQPNPNAMVLATADASGRPSARIVLCKELVLPAGYLVFYTGYRSRKGRELDANPRACAVLHWDSLGRQVRIEGPVVRAPAAESDAYFATRSPDSQLSAIVSAQSEPIDSRASLLERARLKGAELALEARGDAARGLARPAHWGGFRLWAERVELWVAAPSRLHDRALWNRPLTPTGDGFAPGPWSALRLQP